LFWLVAVALGLSMLGGEYPLAVYRLLGYPSGFLSAFMLGMRVGFNEGHEILIEGLHGQIRLIAGCCGFSFFCILCSFGVYSALRLNSHQTKWRYIGAAFFLAYGVTIVTNTIRIVCSFHVHRISQIIFPSVYLDIIHRGVGISIFLTSLLIVSLFIERTVSYGTSQ